MHRCTRLIFCAALAALNFSSVARAAECADFGEWINASCRRLVDTYRNGNDELLVSGFAWHIPASWTKERRDQENENAWGAGWARTVERPNGDDDMVYFLVFKDSHSKPQFNLGYGWATYWGERSGVQPGLGYTAFLMSRSDIANWVPVPVILPLFAVRYQNATMFSTYIPKLNGGVNHGSVLYVFGKISFN